MAAVWSAAFVKPTDPGYLAWCGRMMQKAPDWGRPRSAGEHVGAIVEDLVRRWLAWQGPLQQERILRWHERGLDGTYAYRYREIDAVRLLGPRSVMLYEVKVTTEQHMVQGWGAQQLRAAADVLRADRHAGAVLQRLVYVAREPLRVGGGLPDVAVSDLTAPAAVLWLTPADIGRFAAIEGVTLPRGWWDPQVRGRPADDGVADWHPFADTSRRAGGLAGRPASPFALALQRATGR